MTKKTDTGATEQFCEVHGIQGTGRINLGILLLDTINKERGVEFIPHNKSEDRIEFFTLRDAMDGLNVLYNRQEIEK